MKSQVIKIGLFSLLFVMLADAAVAQRTSRRRANAAGNSQQNTQAEPTEQNNNTRPPSGYNPYGNIPIEVDSSNNANNVTKKSLRNDGAVEKTFLNERTPLHYEHLRWDDALYAEKVWRELDLREKMNQPFRYDAEDDNGNQMFMNILLKAVRQDSVVAFADDRFTTPYSGTEVEGQLGGGAVADTVPVYDPNDINKVVKYTVTKQSFDPKEVLKLRIKEEWVFDREASRMFVRILGIAPVRTIKRGNSEQSSVLFWIYYPDLRKSLAKYEVYNPKNMGYGRMTWEELFESRMFSSYITKSTLDNPGNKTIRQVIKDPILALLEGDNLKERIFNYEQDLWSY